MSSCSLSGISRRTALAAIAGSLLSSSGRAASSWPDRPVKIVVPFPPGGVNDVVARIIGDGLRGAFGQNFFVENLSGAGGNLGARSVARAEPDGYAFLVTAPGPLTINQFLYKSMTFAPEVDFAPVSLLATIPSALVINEKVPAKTLGELIAYLTAQPDKVNYGSSGVGTTSHLFAELFKKLAGVEIRHVPYRGGAPMALDLVANQVQLAFPADFSILQNPNLRALAVTSNRRYPGLPDIPTMQEAGLPGFEAVTWFAMVAPRQTPPDLLDRLNAELTRVLQRPELATRLSAIGALPAGGSRIELDQFADAERKKWKAVVASAAIEPY